MAVRLGGLALAFALSGGLAHVPMSEGRMLHRDVACPSRGVVGIGVAASINPASVNGR